MNEYWVVFSIVISVLTLISLTLSLYIFIFFKKLSRGIGRSDLMRILNHLSEIEKENSESIRGINKEVEKIKKDTSYHIQKVSLVRFNPFSEMGGDHSFSVALLDAHLTGFVITGLHTRERTRVYIKKIDKGKCRQDLSREEKEALAKASV
jgi:t-SNARE complex subunit (syntaxin)